MKHCPSIREQAIIPEQILVFCNLFDISYSWVISEKRQNYETAVMVFSEACMQA